MAGSVFEIFLGKATDIYQLIYFQKHFKYPVLRVQIFNSHRAMVDSAKFGNSLIGLLHKSIDPYTHIHT